MTHSHDRHLSPLLARVDPPMSVQATTSYQPKPGWPASRCVCQARGLVQAQAGKNSAVAADHHRPQPAEAPSRMGRLLSTCSADKSGCQEFGTVETGSEQQ
jgi:hypothetical protein